VARRLTPSGLRALWEAAADAAANRETVLAAAAVAIRGSGEEVPMATIAAAAGVGIGSLDRHCPTPTALLAALAERSYNLVLAHARTAAESDEPGPTVLARFLGQIIAVHDHFVLPLHGGPVNLDKRTVSPRTEIATCSSGSSSVDAETGISATT
jgi:AcrR family transcriptional regulator